MVRLGWVDETTFTELVALAQVLPGPSSSQLGMAVGHIRAGWAGAAAAWVGFTLPSAVLMVLAAVLWTQWPGPAMTTATHGLLLVAVAVVTQAVVQMYRSQCKTPLQGLSAWTAFAVLLVFPGPWTLPGALVLGSLAGGLFPGAPDLPPPPLPAFPQRRRTGLVALGLFAVLAVGLPWIKALGPSDLTALADAFYRTGSWVFGGGHVVLPWLDREVVKTGWVSPDAFLAGYGAAQALPGPLFTFAAYLGMVAGGLPGAVVSLVAIFLPGFLLIGGVLPFWSRLRVQPRWRGAFAGASATVVGMLAATLVSPIGTALVQPADWAVAAGLFLLLEVGRWPAWAVALAGALVGPLVFLVK